MSMDWRSAGLQPHEESGFGPKNCQSGSQAPLKRGLQHKPSETTGSLVDWELGV
jgi:hypothetical protein